MSVLCRHSMSVHIHVFVPKGLEKKYVYLKFTENKHGLLKFGGWFLSHGVP